MNNNWYEITTNPHDPTQVTMRRLKDEEARQAQVEELERWAKANAHLFASVEPIIQDFLDNIASLRDTIPDDPKRRDRKRSRQDLAQKRNWLRHNRKNY